MCQTATTPRRGWREIERYTYVRRAYPDVWLWLAGHLSTLGAPLPDGGHSVELRIRPGGREVSRPVRFRVGGFVADEDRARAALNWDDATNPHAFPHLEAMLEIAPVPNDAAAFTQLGVRARYRPPFGPLGAIADRLVGAEVTDAALTAFLDDLADAVVDHTLPPLSQPEAERMAAPGERDDPCIRRVLLTVDGLAVRRGGALDVWEALIAVPGVEHVSLDPWTGFVAVDHDPAACTPDQFMAALEQRSAAPPV